MDFVIAMAFTGSVAAVVVAWAALVRSGTPGPPGPQGSRGKTYYPLVAVHEVKPGSIVHLHNVSFADDPTTEEVAMSEIMKGIGHNDFLIVRTEGDADASEMVGVWPEGEFADRVRALFEKAS